MNLFRPLIVSALLALALFPCNSAHADPELISTQSSMRHSANGQNFYYTIEMPNQGPRSVDPRQKRNREGIVLFFFDQDIDSIESIETSHGSIQIWSGVRGNDPDSIAVYLADLPDDIYLTVQVNGIQSNTGLLDKVVGTVGMLTGDVDGNGQVNFTDIRNVANYSGQAASNANNVFRRDLDLSTQINFTDIRTAANRSGRRLPNTAPTVAGLENQTITPGVSTGALPFVVDDFTTPAENLVVTTSSSDTSLIPSGGIQVNGLGGNRTITVTPTAGQTGTATITVTVSDGSLSGEQNFDVNVSDNTPPIAFVAADNFLGVAPLTVNFDASASQDLEDNITQYAWNFDGSTTGNGKKTSHTFNQPGTYEVELAVTDSAGQSDLITQVVTVSDGSFNLNTTPSKNDASRFLWQTTFGPTENDVNAVRNLGYAGWINSQIGLSPTLLTQDLFNKAKTRNGAGQVFDQRFAWANIAVEAQDQLRQRVAWALIQILVINNDQDNSGPTASMGYYNKMLNHAFGNYRDLLADVTFSAPMGHYLTYWQNRKANSSAGTNPDENYAREIMQLFSIGLWELNLDGTLKLDNEGKQIPTYDIDDIKQFARVFTGFDISNIGGNWEQRLANPMRMRTDWHEYGPKQLLNYSGAANNGYIPARSWTQANGIADVNFAVDNVFNHPSCPPFISRQLIQRLITSNPTPAYVERVASVFVNDGTGERGNLEAVIKAILLDPEARDRTYSNNPLSGKIIEPFMLKWALFRTLDRLDRPSQPFGLRVDQFQFGEHDKFAQAYLTSPSVFNFYLPDYTAPNSQLHRRGAEVPELQIHNEITVFTSLENHRSVSVTRWDEREPAVYDDLRPLANNPSALVDAVDELLMYGTMSPEMKSLLVATVNKISGNTDRVRAVVYLTIASPEFQVIN